jgi:hypothetical protein
MGKKFAGNFLVLYHYYPNQRLPRLQDLQLVIKDFQNLQLLIKDFQDFKTSNEFTTS